MPWEIVLCITIVALVAAFPLASRLARAPKGRRRKTDGR